MVRVNKTLIGLAIGAFMLLSGVLALALDDFDTGPMGEPGWVRACARAVIEGTPSGQRAMTFKSSAYETSLVGVVRGSVKTRAAGDRWSQIDWTCRLHPKSKRVLRVAFAWPTGGNRLLAAASHLR